MSDVRLLRATALVASIILLAGGAALPAEASMQRAGSDHAAHKYQPDKHESQNHKYKPKQQKKKKKATPAATSTAPTKTPNNAGRPPRAK